MMMSSDQSTTATCFFSAQMSTDAKFGRVNIKNKVKSITDGIGSWEKGCHIH